MTLIEDRRLVLQTTTDAAKTQYERNQLGQFATPTLLASEILRFARTLIPTTAPVRFLDPGIGTGSFYAALLRTFPHNRIAAATGFEIDPHYGRPGRELWREHDLDLRLEDFTQATPPPLIERYDLIICNPPYVRHHHIKAIEKARLQLAAEKACKIRIGGLSGLYCYFLGLSHAWLADDGIAGWLIPSEFMDVNYGRAIKEYLLKQVELIRIHRFDPDDLQFGDALVSSTVVWFRKCLPQAGHIVEFTYGGTHEAPLCSRHIAARVLETEAKWSRFPTADVRIVNEGLRLSDFFKIQRGLATGDNRFFLMTRAEIAERHLPEKFFKPILPNPRYIKTEEIKAEQDGAPLIDRQLFLLDCHLPEEEVQAYYPTLWAYLETGKSTVSERYLCSHRTPWYSQETRPPALFVCTYMGRSNLKSGKPFRFILNRSQATAPNVYLMLYPKPALARAIELDQSLAHKIWSFLNDIAPASLLGEGRVYGGGLYKMEPKELANVPADALTELLINP